MESIYLDYQSATPLLPAVAEVMAPFLNTLTGSPSSLHQHGLRVREALFDARTQVAALIGAESPDDILFTSSGTESANLAVKGTAWASRRGGNHLVVLETDHPAILSSAEFLQAQGFVVAKVPVDSEGFFNPDQLRHALQPGTILVCLHLANHDVGTIQPVAAAGEIAADAGIPLFVDATACGGWLPVDVQKMGASLLSLSPHRFYGPKGVGVLYRHRRARLENLIHGGIQEGGRRAGTENVAGIVGAGKAAELATTDIEYRMRHTRALQSRLWERLSSSIPCLRLNGPIPGPLRLSVNLNVSFDGVEGEALALALDMQGIAVSSGPSCVSKSIKISHVLQAMGLDHAWAKGNLMFSVGRETTEAQVDRAAVVTAQVVLKLRKMSPFWNQFHESWTAEKSTPGSTRA